MFYDTLRFHEVRTFPNQLRCLERAVGETPHDP